VGNSLRTDISGFRGIKLFVGPPDYSLVPPPGSRFLPNGFTCTSLAGFRQGFEALPRVLRGGRAAPDLWISLDVVEQATQEPALPTPLVVQKLFKVDFRCRRGTPAHACNP